MKNIITLFVAISLICIVSCKSDKKLKDQSSVSKTESEEYEYNPVSFATNDEYDIEEKEMVQHNEGFHLDFTDKEAVIPINELHYAHHRFFNQLIKLDSIDFIDEASLEIGKSWYNFTIDCKFPIKVLGSDGKYYDSNYDYFSPLSIVDTSHQNFNLVSFVGGGEYMSFDILLGVLSKKNKPLHFIEVASQYVHAEAFYESFSVWDKQNYLFEIVDVGGTAICTTDKEGYLDRVKLYSEYLKELIVEIENDGSLKISKGITSITKKEIEQYIGMKIIYEEWNGQEPIYPDWEN